jgi:LuxR family transcriptional regulator
MVRSLETLQEIAPDGYAVALHIRFARPTFMRSTFPDAWQAEYEQRGLAMRDPMLSWAITRSGATRWSEVSVPDPFRVMEAATAHGLRFGATASHGGLGRRSVAGVTSREREFTDTEIGTVARIVRVLHETLERPARLDGEERQTLKLSADGLTEAEAADRLGIEPAAYRARLSAACETLEADDVDDAVEIARDFRLI